MKTPKAAFLLTLLHISSSLGDNPIVELPNGKILGLETTTADNNTYYLFEKIPFAAPPVGNLRFRPPQPPANWDGILNTTNLDISCYQIVMSSKGTQSEDCLYLNVYTPKLSNDEPLAVMYWVYGGAFFFGTSYTYRPDLFVTNDVILVTVNYRLGAFGFISTEDEVIPGNNGLKDQVLGLKWVQENIHLFGGDPTRVTIFGQSAGAGSVAYHLLNPNNEGLFSRVIIESGSFLSPGMYQRNARQIAFGTAALLDATFETSEDSQALYEFLLGVTADDLAAASENYTNLITNVWDNVVDPGSAWAPVIEAKNPDAFITKKQYGLLKAGNILPVTTMMGFNSEENLVRNQDADVLKEALEAIDEHLEYLVPKDMNISNLEDLVAMGGLIRDIYTGGEPFVDHLGAGVRYSSDNTFSRPMMVHATLFSQIAPTYFYQFSYDGEIGGMDVHYGDGSGSVAHEEEVRYLFCGGQSCIDDVYPEEDLVTRQRLIRLWTNFAKYENPTPEPEELLQNVTWPRVSTDEGDFLYLDIGQNLEVGNHPKSETYEKWIELYDSLDFDDFDTY